MSAPEQPTPEAMTVETLWTDLCEKDDRTSPEEYPDHALITFDELKYCCESYAAQRAAEAVDTDRDQPIRMILFCPTCGRQHNDAANWESPPHKTHQCQSCGHLWRPAARYTEGVADVALGTSDTRPPIRDASQARRETIKTVLDALHEKLPYPTEACAIIRALADHPQESAPDGSR